MKKCTVPITGHLAGFCKSVAGQKDSWELFPSQREARLFRPDELERAFLRENLKFLNIDWH